MNFKLFSIPKNYLLSIAGILWVIAGTMVFLTGLKTLVTIVSVITILAAISVFFILFFANSYINTQKE